jgi:lipoate-protein ligase B
LVAVWPRYASAGHFRGKPGYTGVWVTSATKIAAMGVKVDVRGITSHGFALNVNPDLRYDVQ